MVALSLALAAHSGLGNGLQWGVLWPAIQPPGGAQGVAIARDQLAHQFVIEAVAREGQGFGFGRLYGRPGIAGHAIAVFGGNAGDLATSHVGLDAPLGCSKPYTAADFDIQRIQCLQSQGVRS